MADCVSRPPSVQPRAGNPRRRALRRGVAAAFAGVAGWQVQAEPGVNDLRIRLGQSAVLSGAAQALGQDYRAGIQLAFDRVNRAGGVHGRQLELLSYDDANDARRSVANTVRLIDDDRVFALIGYVATGNLAAALPVAEQSGVPMLAPLVGTTAYRARFNALLFHVRASYAVELRKIMLHLSALGVKDLAVVYQDSAFGKVNLGHCLQQGREFGIALRHRLPMEMTARQAVSQARTLHTDPPGAVLMIMAGSMVEVFLNDYRQQPTGVPVYTLSAGILDAQAAAQRLQGRLEGVVTSRVVPSPQQARFAIVADYQRDRRRFGVGPNSHTCLEGYIAARVMIEGFRRSGKALSRDGFVQSLENLGATRIGDFPVHYTARNHNGSSFVGLEMYQRDGRILA